MGNTVPCGYWYWFRTSRWRHRQLLVH